MGYRRPLCRVAGLCLLWGQAAVAGPVGPAAALSRSSLAETRSVTVPFDLDHNRIIVEIELARSDGTTREARAWLDTGSEYLTLAESLARDLGLDVSVSKQADGSAESASPTPPARLGGLPLSVEGVGTRVRPGAHVFPGVPAEATLPASLLRHDHVVLDYPARRLTVARPGVLEPKGTRVACRVNADTGLFLVAATIDGETVPLGVDTGSAGTWVSETLTTQWRSRHPDWPHATGAAGSANFFGFPFESAGDLMRLPTLSLGAVRAHDVGLLGLDQGLFDWYSRKSAGPVLGFIGANVLRNFRVEIDFPNQATYWEAGPAARPDLEIVGLTLRPEADGSLSVAGVVMRGGKPAVRGIEPGDKLMRVDGWETTGATMGAAVEALRGAPGSKHALVIERDGTQSTVEAEVLRLP